MRNPNFAADLSGWAALHHLRPTNRYACGHGLIGRGLQSEEHLRLCLGDTGRLIAHGSVWRAGSGRVLVTFPFGPVVGDPEHIVFWQAVQAYAARVGAIPFTPGYTNHLHRLYDDPDSCVVVYGVGLAWNDLRALCGGVERSWVPQPSPLFGERRARGDRQP